MPPPRRNRRHASPAAVKARTPLWMTPQMSRIHASQLGESSAIEDKIGTAAGVMRGSLEQIAFEWKWRLTSSRGRCGDHLIFHQPRPAEQRPFAVKHAKSQNACQEPVIVNPADDQGETKVC